MPVGFGIFNQQFDVFHRQTPGFSRAGRGFVNIDPGHLLFSMLISPQRQKIGEEFLCAKDRKFLPLPLILQG